MPAVPFVAKIPQYAQDLNNEQSHLVGDMIIQAMAWTADNGTIMAADILSITWKGNDVTNYVYECQPETWDRLKDAAKANFIHANVTS